MRQHDPRGGRKHRVEHVSRRVDERRRDIRVGGVLHILLPVDVARRGQDAHERGHAGRVDFVEVGHDAGDRHRRDPAVGHVRDDLLRRGDRDGSGAARRRVVHLPAVVGGRVGRHGGERSSDAGPSRRDVRRQREDRGRGEPSDGYLAVKPRRHASGDVQPATQLVRHPRGESDRLDGVGLEQHRAHDDRPVVGVPLPRGECEAPAP